MTKRIGALMLLLAVIPASAQAAWWNPFSWAAAKPSAVATTTPVVVSGISGSRIVPTIEELQSRIADLEAQLRAALSRADVAEASAAKAAAPAPQVKAPVSVPAAALSESGIDAKTKASVVLIESATSTAVGAVFDASGRILTDTRIWIKDQAGITPITVTLSSGAKKPARLIGIDETRGVAVVQIMPSGSYPYLKPVYESGLSAGDAAFVLGYGSSPIKSSVAKKTADGIELVAEGKPRDNGSVIVNDRGELVGIPTSSICRVLEQGTNCLKYTVAETAIQAVAPKIIAGMRLFIRKEYSSPTEQDIRGQLDGMYQGVKTSGVIEYAIAAATGPNSFDNFNNKLSNDEDGKMTKLYLQKLKQIAEAQASGADFLKNQTYNLRTFLIDHSADIATLGTYQQQIIKNVQSFNSAKLAEYTAKLDLLTKRKNEYDAYLAAGAGTTHDYLMEEGAFLEGVSEYFKADQKTLLDSFSGESVRIF
ncbi:MAG TPA: S1C family serine protease [Candidatus Paceibacterota bacterium]|nr:S1C family serine protease [Candidatus Paceibacterota bacterium]